MNRRTKESARALDRDELDYFIVWDGEDVGYHFMGICRSRKRKVRRLNCYGI